MPIFTRIAKRLIDILVSAVGLFILSPLLLCVGLAVYLNDQGPVLFRQVRIGYAGKPFRILKFRTMVVSPEPSGGLLTIGDDRRVTRIGRFLRRLKLDELPQLFNVLIGQMSLVGPRPEVPHYVDMYSPSQRQILLLKPGITDPASVKYRHESILLAKQHNPEAVYVNAIMPDKIRLNLEYASKANVFSDCRVIISTVASLLIDGKHEFTKRVLGG